jgi:hypothetical protein
MDNIFQKKIQALQLANAQLREELQKLQEVTKKQLKNAEDKDLKELPGKEGESAHNKLHSLLGKYLGRK